MDTSVLKNFAQESRRYLMDVVKKKIEYYLTTDSVEIRARKHLIDDLRKEIADTSKDQVVEKIAYTWFNRFCALRYMDVKQYSILGVATPLEGHTQPEILMEAKQGHIKEEFGNKKSRDYVVDLLSGKVTSTDPQSDAYKLLLLMACNYYHSVMPFLFEKIDDYTELLMPDDLLSESSIISKVREALNPENCENVEVIGWLYQFYISEKKDEVFEGLKKNKKITPENIPAATQLFTPNWIVRYLVENSLGRLWMLNRPKSNLIFQMEYYIKPESEEKDFLKINGPEEIKVCDPACGSGHMLVYAFDLLYSMYEEDGRDPNEIPSLILKNNLFGVEIDKRAGELAAFALTMKAREKQRRYFRNPIHPNICVLENIHFLPNEIKEYMDHVDRDLFTEVFQNTLYQFENAKNFGSLIRPELKDVDSISKLLEDKNVSGNLFLAHTHEKVLNILSQAKYLSPQYHVVIANPPYMGGKGMNGELGAWAKDNYPNSKSDLFAMFIERGLDLVPRHGFSGMVTMQSWMFLSSFEDLRIRLLSQTSIESMAHMANMVMGIAFGTSATVWKVGGNNSNQGSYCYVEYSDINNTGKPNVFPPQNERNKSREEYGWFFRASASDFKKIPGSPIAYSASQAIFNLFEHGVLSDYADTRLGMATADNNRFLRYFFEIDKNKIAFTSPNRSEAARSQKKWFPYQKGGNYRKWYGNNEYCVNWENDGEAIQNFKDAGTGKVRSHNYNLEFIFKRGITWNALTSGKTSARISEFSLFDNAGSSLFTKEGMKEETVMGLVNSNIMLAVFPLISPTLNYQPGDLSKLPILFSSELQASLSGVLEKIIHFAKNDWNSYETSWDFKRIPLLNSANEKSLKDSFQKIRTEWSLATKEMQVLETENNRIFIEAYGLQNELTPDVPLNEITLTCNPRYRYGGEKTDEDLDALLLADTMKEFISYGVGCMFGRYSLDKEGLVLANQGETYNDYIKQVPKPSFVPDEDNVIPILDGDWFVDEISEKFKKFLKVTFGEEKFSENLKFIEDAIGKDIKKYFAKDFYNDHVKTYKKRPIYWMFSSPNGTFNALIYMHRYTPDTVNIVLNNYLREFRAKLNAKRENLERLVASGSSTAATLKEIEQLKKMIVELDLYEKDILYPLATKRIAIDLDDGVKVNYPKFGKALKPIKGLDKDEE